MFPSDDDETILQKSAKGAAVVGSGGLFPTEGEGKTIGDRIQEQNIGDYTDRSRAKQKARMNRNVHEEMNEGVPVNRAAKRAMAKKKRKAAKKKR